MAISLGSCASTAVLELQLMLPARGDGAPNFGLVQVRRASENPFEVDWVGTELEAVELGDAPTRVQLSVVTSAPDTDVHVKVRFCRSPGCDSIEDGGAPELWYSLERPLYLGRRTSWATCIAEVPADPPQAIEVDRCEIRGCLAGGSSTSYCVASGAHLCETSAVDRAPSDLRCVGDRAEY
jgi:hypothetical protein